MRRTFSTFSLSLFITAATTVLAAPPPRAATTKETPEYHAVVKLVESHYGVKHRGIPFIANAGVKTAKLVSKDAQRVLRFGDFKLAIFEDQDFSGRDAKGDLLRTRLRRTLEPDWHPLLAVRVEEEGQTFTYTKADGDKYKVLILVIGQRDATVLQVDLNRAEFAKLLMNPEQESRELTNEATSDAPE